MKHFKEINELNEEIQSAENIINRELEALKSYLDYIKQADGLHKTECCANLASCQSVRDIILASQRLFGLLCVRSENE